jgi:hypothetical protein
MTTASWDGQTHTGSTDELRAQYAAWRQQHGGRRQPGMGGGRGGMRQQPPPPPPSTTRPYGGFRAPPDTYGGQGSADDEALYGGHGAQWYADVADPASYWRRISGFDWPEPIMDHGPPTAPVGAPRFADANGMVRANGYNPMTGVIENVNSYYPWGGSQAGTMPSVQQMIDQRQWAMIPWQNSWADPSSPDFYMRAQNLGPIPQNYFVGGPPPGGYSNGPGGPPPGGPPQ